MVDYDDCFCQNMVVYVETEQIEDMSVHQRDERQSVQSNYDSIIDYDLDVRESTDRTS